MREKKKEKKSTHHILIIEYIVINFTNRDG